MKKAVSGLALILLFVSCGYKREGVDIVYEDGVEVVLNQVQPYRAHGRDAGLFFEEVISIDFGSEKIGELGLANSTDFCVDPEGFIYFIENPNEGNRIYKFTPEGRFERSFGRKGQGPGEIEYAFQIEIDPQGRLAVSDFIGRKILVYSHDGGFVEEIRHPKMWGYITRLPQDRFLYRRVSHKENENFSTMELALLDSEMNELKVLDSQKEDDPDFNHIRGVNIRVFFQWETTGRSIFVMSESRGYEILKFDLQGNLLRKIRKQYQPVPVSDEIIAERTKQIEQSDMKAWFPKHWLPVCDFFCNEDEWIYVMTFARGENGGYIYNIFNPDGIYVADAELDILQLGDRFVCARARNNRLYYFTETPEGFREFKVCRVKWQKGS